jgi:hypothetical protein
LLLPENLLPYARRTAAAAQPVAAVDWIPDYGWLAADF